MSTDPGSTSLPPDEAAFHAAWLGKLWPRYRPLFEGGVSRGSFEWRAALYPLWLGVPGLYRQLVAAILVVVLASIRIAASDSNLDVLTVALLVGGQLILWPGLAVALLYVGVEEGMYYVLHALGMVAFSLILGALTPRWIVAEGRRRWRHHAARVAAGEAPALPRSITKLSPLRLVVTLANAAVVTWVLFFPQHHHDEEMPSIAAMKSDLRNLVTAEESYFADHMTYTTSLDTLYYRPSPLVTVTITAADSTGYAAVARHAETTKTCGLFVGTGTPPYAGVSEGEPRCAPLVTR